VQKELGRWPWRPLLAQSRCTNPSWVFLSGREVGLGERVHTIFGNFFLSQSLQHVNVE
jgi:hypothetical protein